MAVPTRPFTVGMNRPTSCSQQPTSQQPDSEVPARKHWFGRCGSRDHVQRATRLQEVRAPSADLVSNSITNPPGGAVGHDRSEHRQRGEQRCTDKQYTPEQDGRRPQKQHDHARGHAHHRSELHDWHCRPVRRSASANSSRNPASPRTNSGHSLKLKCANGRRGSNTSASSMLFQ